MLMIAQKMLADNNLCVLATCRNNLPNSSLMHYLYDSSSKNIYMLTLQGSAKHNNILDNPQVSLLIDTRMDGIQSGLPVMALTVYGRAEFIRDPQRHQAVVEQMADRFKNLAKLADDSQCRVVQVEMEKILMLDGVDDKSMIDI